MKRTLAGAGVALFLAAAALFFFGPFRQEPLQLIYRDGPRSMYLDTRSVAVMTTEDGARYLDVTVRQTYTFTADYDLTRYFLLADARQYQPITATGCDKDGNVLELWHLQDTTVSWRPLDPGSNEEKIYDAAWNYARKKRLF